MTPEERKARVASLANTVENFGRQGLGNDERCLAALEELNRLRSHLEFRKSVTAIRTVAEQRHYISYGDVGAASGFAWKEARRTIDRHLDELCRWAHLRGWPLITALVVEKPNVTSGKLEGVALDGFIRTAKRLDRYVTGDEKAFLKAEQESVFAWADAWRGQDVFSVVGGKA